jgi:hypothetical protein
MQKSRCTKGFLDEAADANRLNHLFMFVFNTCVDLIKKFLNGHFSMQIPAAHLGTLAKVYWVADLHNVP